MDEFQRGLAEWFRSSWLEHLPTAVTLRNGNTGMKRVPAANRELTVARDFGRMVRMEVKNADKPKRSLAYTSSATERVDCMLAKVMQFFATLVIASLLVAGISAATRASAATPGDPAQGKAYWEKFTALWCLSCHGPKGEGAYGPDLAGRGLSFEQFKQAVRQPWGVMPAYTEEQASDQNIADMVAYFNSLPKVAQPGPWRTLVPQGAPLGRRLIIETAGCAQCHGGILDNVRREAGGDGADFHWFEEMVYQHTKEFPTGRMGNYSKARLPEIVLNEIWRYISVDVGLRAPVNATIKASSSAGTVSYELTVENAGKVGKGLAAENMYISMRVPSGSTVVSASDRGYQGIQPYAAGGYNVAVWLVPSVAAGEKPVYTLRVSGSGAEEGAHAFVHWLKPTVGGEFAITPTVRP